MQVQGVQSLSNITLKPGVQGPLDQLSSGDIVQAEVTSVDQGSVTLRLPQGQQLEASQRTMDFLQPGDTLSLMVSKGEGQPTKLELLSVNGQPVNAQATASEYALMEMRIAPTQANLAVAAALGRMGAPIQPGTFARMGELAARFPSLPPDAALALAASSLPLNEANVEAFTQWLQSPAQASGLAEAAAALARQDPQAAALLEQAANQLLSAARDAAPQQPQLAQGQLPDGLSPSLVARLDQSGIWTEMQAQLPKLSPGEAQGRILQLMSDLPINTTAQERGIIYSALSAMRAQPEAQAAQETQPPRPAAPGPAQGAQPGPEAQPMAPEAALPRESQALPQALSSLFAALGEALPGERGQALKEAAAGLEAKLQAFTGSLRSAEDAVAAAKVKPVLEMGQTLVTQVQMGSELGNLMYVPLPVTLNQRQQDAALYVLKRNGGGSKVDDSNVTVAICLETQNLGAVDTLLKVERNDLSLQFRVDSQEAKSFIQPRLSRAASLSFPSQYQFRGAAVVLKDSPMTPANAGQVMQKAFGITAAGGLDISV